MSKDLRVGLNSAIYINRVDTDRANRTDGTNKATSETQVMCVV